MATYKLSSAAEKDLIGIYKYGKNRFGTQQAKKYLLSLDGFFIDLAEKPNLARDARMLANNLKFYNYKGSCNILFDR